MFVVFKGKSPSKQVQVTTPDLKLTQKAMTDKQKFYRLLSDVCEVLPTSAINAAISGGYDANAVQLLHVRQGRIINLHHLVALIQFGLPEFNIPTGLLPKQSAKSPKVA